MSSEKDIRFFRRVFLDVLEMVKLHYPAARVRADKGGLLLGHSPPPVPSRQVGSVPEVLL